MLSFIFTYERDSAHSTKVPFVEGGITEKSLKAAMIYTQTQIKSRTHSHKTPQHLSKASLLPPEGSSPTVLLGKGLIKTLLLQLVVLCLVQSQAVEIPITLNHQPSEERKLSTDFYAHNYTQLKQNSGQQGCTRT